MKVTYEIENGKKVKIKTYVDGTVKKYDKKGNIIYYKGSKGYEVWNEYDTNGKLIHHKSNIFEYWYEYDSNGNMIHSLDNHGYEDWYEYDSNGNKIHHKDNRGYEWFAKGYEELKVC